MTVRKFVQSDAGTQTGSEYKTNIDNGIAVHHRLSGAYAPHAQDTPDTTIRVDLGGRWNGRASFTEDAAQNVSGFTTPASARIDWVALNLATGVAVRIAGTESGSPSAPTLPNGFWPICQVSMTSSDATVTNAMITDKRSPMPVLPAMGTVPQQVIKWGAKNITQNATRYASGFGNAVSTTEGPVELLVARPMTVKTLRGFLNAAVPTSQTLVVTLRKNGADTALTFTMNATETTGADTNASHAVTFGVGDRLALKLAASATFTSTIDGSFSALACIPGTDVGAGFAAFNLASAGTAAASMGEPGSADSTTEANVEVPLPQCLVVPVNYRQGASTNHSYHVRCNAASVYTASAGTVATDAQSMLSMMTARPECYFGSGDLFNWRHTATLDVGSQAQAGCVRFDAANDGEYDPCPLLFGAIAQAQSTTNYLGGYGNDGEGTTESENQLPMPAACTVSNLLVAASAAPAAGQTLIYTVRKNGSDTALTCTVTDAGRTASDTSNSVSFAAGDLLSIKCVSSATAGTRSHHCSLKVVT